MLSKIKQTVMSKRFLIGAAVGVVVALAFRRFIPGVVQQAAAALPGSDAKVSA